jgi:molybdopterin/thiamine biosynthesis adenylyltransferase
LELNNPEIRRYSRCLILPEIGLTGQKKIKATNVLCIGKIGIADFDTVDYSNRNTPSGWTKSILRGSP